MVLCPRNRSKETEMPETLSLIDRLRIERVVWALDQRLYDLPRKSRIAKRREVRENLQVAAADVGVAAALRNLGNTRRLAAEYRAAEFGDESRPAWLAAAVFLLTAQLFFTAFLAEAANAFGAGIKAANPAATGTFTWSGLGYVQNTVTYTLIKRQGLVCRRRLDAVRLGAVGHRDRLRRSALARRVTVAPPPSRSHQSELSTSRPHFASTRWSQPCAHCRPGDRSSSGRWREAVTAGCRVPLEWLRRRRAGAAESRPAR